MNYYSGIVNRLQFKRNEKLIYKEINLTIHKNNIIILKGKNGSGKSTLLKTITSLINKSYGTIYVNKNAIHYVNNIDGFNPNNTLLDNLYFWIYLFKGNINVLVYYINLFGLRNYIDTPINLLSTGQRKKLSFIKLCCISYPFWVLDEPTLGLDKKTIVILQKIFHKHRKLGGTILIATHINIKQYKPYIIRL